MMSPIQVLLVEDNPGDARLAREALADSKLRLEVVEAHDGEVAIEVLRKAHTSEGGHLPDLILPTWNLPRKDGREVLADVKNSPEWKHIPVVVLTSSKGDEDILATYQLHANAYISKPIDLAQMERVVKEIKDFWFTIVRLPSEH